MITRFFLRRFRRLDLRNHALRIFLAEIRATKSQGEAIRVAWETLQAKLSEATSSGVSVRRGLRHQFVRSVPSREELLDSLLALNELRRSSTLPAVLDFFLDIHATLTPEQRVHVAELIGDLLGDSVPLLGPPASGSEDVGGDFENDASREER